MQTIAFEREDHYQLFQRPKMDSPRKTYQHVSRDLDYVVEYFRFNELRRQGKISTLFLKDNPYKRDFDAYVEEFLTTHAHLPEKDSLAALWKNLEEKQRIAAGMIN